MSEQEKSILEQFEERAAIIEYEGGEDRLQAEWDALEEIIKNYGSRGAETVRRELVKRSRL